MHSRCGLGTPFVLKSILAKVGADEGLQCSEQHANETPSHALTCDEVTNPGQHGVTVGRAYEGKLNWKFSLIVALM